MKTINQYTIREEIGQGGMSVVYCAYDPENDRDVAIKLMSEALSRNERARDRFELEAQMVIAMEHPAIVPVWDYGEVDGRLYIVMPFMLGGSLRDKLADGPLPLAETVAIIERIAWALDSAHEEQIIHRDVKPHNILLDEHGMAYLADFGVARLMDEDSDGKTITMVGTPEFIAPEQALDGILTMQADVYQLGVTLFYMLTGEQPFKGSSFKLIAQHVSQPVPSAEALNLNLPIGTDTILRQAMAKAPMDRYLTAGTLAMALVDLKADESATQLFVIPTNFVDDVLPELPVLTAVSNEAPPPLMADSTSESVPNWRRRFAVAVMMMVLVLGAAFTFIDGRDVNSLLAGGGTELFIQTVIDEVDVQTTVMDEAALEEVVVDETAVEEAETQTTEQDVESETAIIEQEETVPAIPNTENPLTQADNNNNNTNNNNNGGNRGNGGGGGNGGNGGNGPGNGGGNGGRGGNGGNGPGNGGGGNGP